MTKEFNIKNIDAQAVIGALQTKTFDLLDKGYAHWAKSVARQMDEFIPLLQEKFVEDYKASTAIVHRLVDRAIADKAS